MWTEVQPNGKVKFVERYKHPMTLEDKRVSVTMNKDTASTRRKSTYTRNYHACNSLMRILGANTIVSHLTAGYVNEKLITLDESIGTTNERKTRLKALIRLGYKNDLIEDIK